MLSNHSSRFFYSMLFFFAFHCSSFAQNNTPALIDTPGFERVSQEAFQHRRQRLVDLQTFLALSTQENTIILDTRSAAAYAKKHLSGAVHLNFSDFTASKLAALVPDKNTRILIYCNNNFADDPGNFPTKSAPLALNIPTFINLYGYGYTNIYELKDLLSVKNPQLSFKGTGV